MKFRKLASVMLSGTMVLNCQTGIVPVFAQEENEITVKQEASSALYLNGTVSDNALKTGAYPKFGSVINSYLYETADGFVKVEYKDTLKAEFYNANGRLQKTAEVQLALPIFGAFYHGTDGNYVISGQNNPDEKDEVSIMAVQKLDSDWNEVSNRMIQDDNTYRPFKFGSVAVAESSDSIFVHTCHEMYKYSDGVNHQASMVFEISKTDLNPVRKQTSISNIAQSGYVSHSVDQYAATDKTDLYRVNLGDAYPRGVSLIKSTIGKELTDVTYTIPLEIGGEVGDLVTKVELGGLVLTDSKAVIAGNCADSSDFENSAQRNIFVTLTDKDLSNTKTVYLTSYKEGDNVLLSKPRMAAVSNRILVVWMEADGSVLKAVTLDEDGNVKETKVLSNGLLSDCQPIVTKEGKAAWYAGSGKLTAVYTIDPADLDSAEFKAHEHDFEEISRTDSTCSKEGTINLECPVCHEKKTEPLPLTAHEFGEVQFVWASDSSSCAASRTCKNCSLKETAECQVEQSSTNKEDVITAKAEFDGTTYTDTLRTSHSHDWQETDRSDADCTHEGKIVYECSKCHDTREETKQALGHVWGETVFNWNSSYDSCKATQTCSSCKVVRESDCTVASESDDSGITYTATARFDDKDEVSTYRHNHSYTEESRKDATCDQTGSVTIQCSCGLKKEETLPATGHNWSNVRFNWSDDHSSCKASRTCSNCGRTESKDCKVEISSEGTNKTYTAKAVFDDNEYKDVLVLEDNHTHNWKEESRQEPTCEEDGKITFRCSCNELRYEVIKATGHTYSAPVFTWAKDYTSCRASRRCDVCGSVQYADCTVEENSSLLEIKYTATAVFGDETFTESVTVDANHEHVWVESSRIEPGCVNEGVINFDCECGESHQEVIPAAGHTYKKQPEFEWNSDLSSCTAILSCKKCDDHDDIQCIISEKESGDFKFLTASAVSPDGSWQDTIKLNKDGSEIVYNFGDVKEGIWYHDIVYGAARAGLMTGLNDSSFGPNETMTRGMAVTVMYRMAGSPSADGESNFKDVNDGLWYSDPIAWAYNAGIVKGYTGEKEGYFGPNDQITREQLCTMIYRYMNWQDKNTEGRADLSGFHDADKVGSYAVEAIQYCVDVEIISGAENGTKLNPTHQATRAECAKMLLFTSRI